MPPRTLRSNVEVHLTTGIPRESLSQSFKDAITVTKHLGYRYLWIDSLCIIQDDDRDWERECGRMADVYGNADLVIAATSAADGSCGFLGPRLDYFEGALRLEGPRGPNQMTWTVSYRSSLPHNPWLINQEAFRPADEGPLESRAWAYQERVMARRYVSFGRHELCWECTTMLECECCSIQGCRDDSGTLTLRKRVLAPRKYNLRRKLAQTLTTSLLLSAWRQNTVEPYSRRKLYKASDRLMAISASAAAFSEKVNGRYLAGIWSEDLRNGGLYWYTTEVSTRVEYGAPSWSWASVTGGVTHLRRRKLKLDWGLSPEVLNIDYAAPPENRFGCPTYAAITLRGNAIHGVKLIYKPKSGFDIQLPAGHTSDLFVDTELEPIRVSEKGENPIISARRRRHIVDSVTESDDERDQLFEGLCCLSLATPVAMVLGLVSLKPRQYERIGLCVLELRRNINPWKQIEVTLI